jgi:hypothetical protein
MSGAQAERAPMSGAQAERALMSGGLVFPRVATGMC